MPGRRARSSLREGGQSLAEFAMVMPIFIILAFGIIDFGMGLRAYIGVAQASREAARYASVGNPPGTFTSGGTGDCDGSVTTNTVGRACKSLNGLNLDNVLDVDVVYPSGTAPGEPVEVAIAYKYNFITPVDRVVNFFSSGALDDSITVSSSTSMRLE